MVSKPSNVVKGSMDECLILGRFYFLSSFCILVLLLLFFFFDKHFVLYILFWVEASVHFLGARRRSLRFRYHVSLSWAYSSVLY